MEKKMVFVNVYKVTRRFGGHEEGGWWYNDHSCIETYPCREENAEDVKAFLKKEHEDVAYGDIYSVRGGAELAVHIEDRPAESETRERPVYE